jgi:hypothetical protein
MKSGFLEKLIERLGRIGPEDVQNYLIRRAEEKGFFETVFSAVQEGIIVTDSNGRVTYLNAACELFGLRTAVISRRESLLTRLSRRFVGDVPSDFSRTRRPTCGSSPRKAAIPVPEVVNAVVSPNLSALAMTFSRLIKRR